MLKSRSPFQLLSAARRTRSGFTLLEILVAVGAVALVSVGIAAIFDSVGKTVNAGRKMSRNQTIATRVEQQMRKDFSQISREGFLLIRQQMASTVTSSSNPSFPFAEAVNVALSDRDVDKDKAPRDRRIDEVLFFAKGKFTSAMEPLTTADPEDSNYYIPTSNEAAIYYGHGQLREKTAPNADVAAIWKTPRLDDDIAVFATDATYPGRIALGRNLPENPNRYASNWILLRKPTLLIQPRTTVNAPPAIADTSFNPNMLQDSDVQISGQPAASSIFQRLSRIYPVTPPAQVITPPARASASRAFWADPVWNDMSYSSGAWLGGATAAQRPLLASGTVDIATTDLAETRFLVNMCPARPAQIAIPYDTSIPPYDLARPDIVLGLGGYEFPDPSATGTRPLWQFPIGTGRWQRQFDADFGRLNPQGAAIFRMHSWMQNALPTRSDGFTSYYELDQNFDPRAVGCRTRCEPMWTSRDDVIRVSDASGGPPADPMETYFKRRNQLALSAHNFLEHCSEFMVEWSFGLTDPRNGNIIWYGTPKQEPPADRSREMTLYRGDQQNAFDPSSPPANLDLEEIPYNPFQGIPGLPTQLTANPALVPALDRDAVTAYRVSKHLIYGNISPFEPGAFPNPEDTDGCFTSHFGYFDPSFNPQAPSDPTDPTSPSFESKGISSLPWAWPKMVRITVRIADESDPTQEDSFQFVIDLPPTPRP